MRGNCRKATDRKNIAVGRTHMPDICRRAETFQSPPAFFYSVDTAKKLTHSHGDAS